MPIRGQTDVTKVGPDIYMSFAEEGILKITVFSFSGSFNVKPASG
jgi:hypothetical protein